MNFLTIFGIFCIAILILPLIVTWVMLSLFLPNLPYKPSWGFILLLVGGAYWIGKRNTK